MPVKLYCYPRLGAMTLPLVDRALLAPHDKLVDIIGREGEARHGDWTCLLVLEIKTFLWLREHVEIPRTETTIG